MECYSRNGHVYLFQGESVSCSGDPLQDFTLIRFLDRFVYRNPKKKGKLFYCILKHATVYH